MTLTDDERAMAKLYKLTHREARLAKAMHLPLEVYTLRKAELQAERDAWEVDIHAPTGRGQRPALEAEDQE